MLGDVVWSVFLTLGLFLCMVDLCPLDVFDEEGFEGAVNVGDEVDGVEEDSAEADGWFEAEFFALDHFDGDEH